MHEPCVLLQHCCGGRLTSCHMVVNPRHLANAQLSRPFLRLAAGLMTGPERLVAIPSVLTDLLDEDRNVRLNALFDQASRPSQVERACLGARLAADDPPVEVSEPLVPQFDRLQLRLDREPDPLDAERALK